MRPTLLIAVALAGALAAKAFAQAPIVATPLPPAATPPSQALAPPPLAPNVWVPRGTALVQALDKVNARATVLTIKVGQAATYGSLTITVKSCVVRPPDQPADAAAFLAVTDKNPGAPEFSGWMVQSDPSLSMLEHPIYDLRVVGCAA